MTRTRIDPEARRTQILTAALAVAAKGHYQHITREAVAEKANCAPGLVSYYYTTMPQLKRAVMRHAIKQGVVIVVAQGLGCDDPYAKRAPEPLKKAALASADLRV